MDMRDLWAKSDPYHPLWCHLLDVAAVCGALLRRFGPIETIPDRWIMYVVALHDIGKADPQFQNKEASLAEILRASGLELPTECTPFRHEARSAEWIVPHLTQWQWNRYACQVVSKATRAHHGDFKAGSSPGTFYEENEPRLQQRTALWNSFREELSALVRDALELNDFAAPEFKDASSAGIRLSGLIVLSDWIASNAELYGYEQLDHNLEGREYFAASQTLAEKIVQAMQFDRTGTPPDDYSVPSFSEVWPEIEQPRPFQSALETICRAGLSPGLAILEAPMGEGKTEGAFYLALHWNRLLSREGVYIALPTMATSNQMYTRYAKFLHQRQGIKPRLIHGMSWLFEPETPKAWLEGEFETSGDAEEGRRAKEWFGSSKRAILAPESVGTVDQVLMAALNVKHGFLRYIGLSVRTLIIDEVHAYDVYMNTLMRRLLSWCRTLNIPVILLSATLSHRQKQDLVNAYGGELPMEAVTASQEAYPLLTFVPWNAPAFCVKAEATSTKTTDIVLHHGMLPGRDQEEKQIAHQKTAELALKLTENGGCLCVLMNTVAGAQAVYRALEDFPHKRLFHARFPAKRRSEIEKEVLALFGKGEDDKPENPSRPERFILVCTQVVEQSLDVDFDAMITQLAPIDLLLQRSGRVWRHERGPRAVGDHPVLHILLPEAGVFGGNKASSAAFGATGIVYAHHEVLLHTLAQLKQRNAFQLPVDFRPLIEACYGNSACPEGVDTALYQTAVTSSQIKDKEDENAAQEHLIKEPSARDFTLGNMQDSVEEGEDEHKASYFRARTRLGDETRNAIFIDVDTAEGKRLQQALAAGVAAKKAGDKKKKAFPGIERLRELFLKKASIPAWWLADLEPDVGEEWIQEKEGPDWARRHTIFFLHEDIWKGHKKAAKKEAKFVLTNDFELGLTLELVQATSESAVSAQEILTEEEDDADVGSTA